tara:strand:- start:10925 stop:15739 length:4815 start_codon:yes stop_codon:yes gene_type:complete
MSLLGSPLFFSSGATSGDFYSFEPQGSLRFEGGRSSVLSRTPSVTGNQKTWTWSSWIKRSVLGTSQSFYTLFSAGPYTGSSAHFSFYYSGSRIDTLQFYQYTGGYEIFYETNSVFRDASSWYHIVLAVDTTQATSTDRVKIYLNGTQLSSFYASTTPNENLDTYLNLSGTTQYIGSSSRASTDNLEGYLSEVYFIDGTALDPTSFGETKSGVWMPKNAKSSLTFGTNGFYLPFNSTVTATGQSTVLYTGTGAGRSVQGFGYKPDFVWYKNRDATYVHAIEDRVRGLGKYLVPDDSLVEGEAGNTIQAFTNDGYYYGPNSAGNHSGNGIVAWAWDAGADQTATGYGCVTYTGSNTIRPVTDIGFSPDLVWIKERTDNNTNHRLFDSVRGPGKNLISNSNSTEGTDSNTQVSFINDGFTLGSNSQVNENGDNFVAWCWDAGDSAPASNSNGTIASTVKASTANGFSVVTYTGNATAGATVGHGLSSTPEMYIVKSRSLTTGWVVYHKDAASSPEDGYLSLNATDDFFDTITWNDTAPTSSVFSLGPSGYSSNNSGATYVAYCWHSVAGYSKIGSYTGNGSATGPTVTCGFRPAFVMIKRADSSGNWYIFDVNRDPDNKGQRYLRPNVNNQEGGSGTGQEYIDFQSNGFQIIADSSAFGEGNTSGGTYIYMAFAGGKDTIAPVNTNGSITSRVKASDDTGFSIVEYEGTGANATFGHGLSSAPDWVVVKNRSFATNWTVYHSANTGSPGTQYLSLNLSDGSNSGGGVVWNSTAPSSSVVSIGTGNAVNRSGDSFIAYCWTATTGKSAFGSFTGNGSSSGPAVTGLGFKPGYLLLKNSTDDNTNWIILDNKRDGDASDVDTYLKADATSAEVTDNTDILVSFDSDGFTLKTAGNDINGSGDTILYMAFVDGQSASFFRDESGNNNNLTPSGVQNYDVVPDNSTNNWCTLNPLSSLGTQSEGNLKHVTGVSGFGSAVGSMGVKSGKWYWEVTITSSCAADFIGLVDETYDSLNGSSFVGGLNGNSGVDSIGYYTTAYKYINGSGTLYGTSYTTDDIIGVALNLDDNQVTFYKNGVSQGAISYTFSGNNILPAASDALGNNTSTYTFNFGQDSSFDGAKTPQGNTDDNGRGDFYFSPPSGYLSLCTQNLPTPTIDPAGGDTSDEYFNTVLYAGNNSTNNITGVGFQPNWVWLKNRSSNSTSHRLYDSVRGPHKALFSTATNAEFDESGWGLDSFDSDGFTLLDDATNRLYFNQTGQSYVAWNWLAGGATPSQTYTVKVVSDSGNKYRFNDFGTSAVTLDLQEGGTYVFDQSDSSNSGHPLRFSSTSDGTHGGGSEYTTGVTTEGTPGSAGAKTTIVVAASAPTLYYYCSVHSGMGGQANTNSTFGSSNFDGTVQSTVSENTKAGFSIVTWTGDGSTSNTIGHGLGAKPDLAIYKRLDNTSDWYAIYDVFDGSFDRLKLNDTSTYANAAGYGTMLDTNTISNFSWPSGSSILAYCFRTIDGYSKVGTYTGNGELTNGTFVYTGFRPAWILIKTINAASQNWIIFDNKRLGYNAGNRYLLPSASNAESTNNFLNIFSNGFKLKTNGPGFNGNNNDYFYVAFADQPFKYANAR